jgi:anthranilate phosphoribosyltransferase
MSATEHALDWPAVIGDLLAGRHLDHDRAGAAMSSILDGDATPAQIAGFIVALRAKGETADELHGMLDAAMHAATFVPLTDDERSRCIDVVGTGGDGSHSVNVSTMASLVVAGAGVPVCKHGNRSASSKCGTADVLELLGVAIELGAEGVAACVRDAGSGSASPRCSIRRSGSRDRPRRELGVATAFNLLGPMANPGRVRRQVIGVADPRFAEPMVTALQRQGLTTAWVVHGDGMDELTTTGVSRVLALDHDAISEFTIDPAGFGLAPATDADLRGGHPEENALAVRRVLAGERGAHRDIVLLNAAAALVVAGAAGDLAAGLETAAAAIDDGRAQASLDALIRVSQAQAAAADDR